MRKVVNKVVREAEIKRLEKEGAKPNYEIIKVSGDDISRKNDNAQQLKEYLKQLLPDIATEYEQLAIKYDENVNQIEALWKSEEIRNLIDQYAPYVADRYKKLSDDVQSNIKLKIELLETVEDKMEQYLPKIATKFKKLNRSHEKYIEQKVELLVDVEELVKIIGRMDNVGWQSIWETAKHLRYGLDGELNLKENVTNYMADSKLKNLCLIQNSVFNELNKMNFDYIAFQDKRMNKRKRQGGYREGYRLISFELVETNENKLGK